MIMKYKMNKNGIIGVGFVMAIFLAIFFLIFYAGAGISTIFSISQYLKSIPTFIWIILGILILFKLLGGRKK